MSFQALSYSWPATAHFGQEISDTFQFLDVEQPMHFGPSRLQIPWHSTKGEADINLDRATNRAMRVVSNINVSINCTAHTTSQMITPPESFEHERSWKSKQLE